MSFCPILGISGKETTDKFVLKIVIIMYTFSIFSLFFPDFEFMLDENNRPVPVSVYAPAGNKSGSFIANRIENKKGYRRCSILSFCFYKLWSVTVFYIISKKLFASYRIYI